MDVYVPEYMRFIVVLKSYISHYITVRLLYAMADCSFYEDGVIRKGKFVMSNY